MKADLDLINEWYEQAIVEVASTCFENAAGASPDEIEVCVVRFGNAVRLAKELRVRMAECLADLLNSPPHSG